MGLIRILYALYTAAKKFTKIHVHVYSAQIKQDPLKLKHLLCRSIVISEGYFWNFKMCITTILNGSFPLHIGAMDYWNVSPSHIQCILWVQIHFNPKGAGSFDPISQPGGGADSAPPSDLGRGATKNYEIQHVRRVSQYERADKIAILKIKAFLNYANLC